MAVSKYILRSNCLALYVICSLLFQCGYSTDELKNHNDGQCIWYGVCKTFEDRFIEKSLYCSYNGTAKPVDNEGREKLIKYCSFLDHGENNTFTCCDNDQIEVMNDNIERAEFILSNCPSCFNNFLQPICEMTCSPRQSQFLKINKVEEEESENGPYVTSIDYSITYQYINETFQSCKKVTAFLIMRSLDFMCGGAKGDDCTPEKWYHFMGDVLSNKYVPFQTNYITEPMNGYIPFNRSTVPCYEAPDASKGKCSCSDCSGSCPVLNNNF